MKSLTFLLLISLFFKQSFADNDAEKTNEYWNEKAQKLLSYKKQPINDAMAKNVIFFLGDGMDLTTIAATRMLLGNEEAQLSFEKFPYTGLSKTYCVDSQVADSACSATAYLTGVKGNIETIGVNSQVTRLNCTEGLDQSKYTYSIAKWAQEADMSTGFVTTTRVTHASPAGLYAHTPYRDWENDAMINAAGCDSEQNLDIARQLIYGETGKNFNVILGGGRCEFYDKNQKDFYGNSGYRSDGRDLITDWINLHSNDTADYVHNKTGLSQINSDKIDYLLGLFACSHNEYNLDNIENGKTDTNPSLLDMTKVAIKILSKNPQGFFLFVEGGRIDHAHHNNNPRYALDETKEFHETIEYVRNEFSDDDTLIIVTADHAHTFTYSGYPVRGNDIFGSSDQLAEDNLKYTTLSYANGPGYKAHTSTSGRVDPLSVDLTKSSSLYTATVPLDSETHGGQDVGVWASGPCSHFFTGNYEQNYIAHAIAYCACIGDGDKICPET